MKWFIDDNGWPQTKSISADEWQGLIHRSEKIEGLYRTTDMDLEDVFDESLLPVMAQPMIEDEMSRCETMSSTEGYRHTPRTPTIWVFQSSLGIKIS
ncbi:hypothetical protein LINGRAHAP2_LOCUS24781 [Linum grandiflorum]